MRLRLALFVLLLSVGVLAQIPQPPSGVHVTGTTVAPRITSLSASSGAVGFSVTITGTGFNTTKGSGSVTFNGTTATTTSWAATSIAATVPSGATTGNVVVTQNSLSSQGVAFTVTGSTNCGGGVNDAVLCDATNTGLAGAGISEGSLTNQGTVTYNSSFNGQTISGRRFTGAVTVTGSNITLNGNLFASTGNSTWMLTLNGTNNTVRNSTFRPASGSTLNCVIVESGSGQLIEKNDCERAENNLSFYGGSNTITQYNYLHNPTSGNAAPHLDGFEVYGGGPHTIQHNVVIGSETNDELVSEFNVASLSPINNINIYDNFIDGSTRHTMIDEQSGNITFMRVKRNRMGGHTVANFFGRYTAFVNHDGGVHPIVQTEAALTASPRGVLWPSGGSDPDRNIWFYTNNSPFGYANLSPNRDGQTISP